MGMKELGVSGGLAGGSEARTLTGHAWEKLAPVGQMPELGCYPEGRRHPGSNLGLEPSLWLGVKRDRTRWR